MKFNKSIIATAVITILVIACIYLATVIYMEKKAISESEFAVGKAMEYIKSTDGSADATLTGISKNKITLKSFYEFAIETNGEKYNLFVTADGRYLISGTNIIDISQSSSKSSQAEGNFKKLENAEVCSENGKPLVYFFGLKTSDESNWEYSIIKDVVSKFGDSISFRDDMVEAGPLDKDQDVFSKYNTSGSVPTIVIGCRYSRVGSGQFQGEEQERTTLKNLICDTTGRNPLEFCGGSI
jgi:hypothetical protein